MRQHYGLRETWGRCCSCTQGSSQSCLTLRAVATDEQQVPTDVRAAAASIPSTLPPRTLLACRSTLPQHIAHACVASQLCARCANIAHASLSERAASLRSSTLWRMSSAACMAVKAQPRPTHPAGRRACREGGLATECPARGTDAGVLAAYAPPPARPKVLGVTLCTLRCLALCAHVLHTGASVHVAVDVRRVRFAGASCGVCGVSRLASVRDVDLLGSTEKVSGVLEVWGSGELLGELTQPALTLRSLPRLASPPKQWATLSWV